MFAPIKVKQREVGAKYDFGRFTTTVSLFQIEKPSGLAIANGDGTSTYRVGMEQRNRGVELNVFGEATRGLRLLGGVAYIDPRLTKTEGGAYDGKRAPNVSRWQLNLGGEYDLPALPGLTLTARMTSTSAVSYTHLDVYKRQIVDNPGQRIILVLQTGLVGFPRARIRVVDLGAVDLLEGIHRADGADQLEIGAVSYTHLDVYKRQDVAHARPHAQAGQRAAVEGVVDPHRAHPVGYPDHAVAGVAIVAAHHLRTVSYTHLNPAGRRLKERNPAASIYN